MGDTPRVDAECEKTNGDYYYERFVEADFARQLERELNEARRDQARYRWLRDEAMYFGYDDGKDSPWAVIGTGHLQCFPACGDELDAAIDAAMTSESETHSPPHSTDTTRQR